MIIQHWCTSHRFLRFLLLGFFLLSVLPLSAQEDDLRLELVDLDASAFPLVRVTLLTADGRSEPINDVSRLTVRENGVPVEDISVTHVPVGADFIFVLDANADFNNIDAGFEASRRDLVADSIKRFATNHMNSAGRDRVSIIVPDAQGGRFLLQDATRPQEVVEAIDAYQPESGGLTLLNAMINQALEHTAGQAGDGRFRSLMLFTDGGRLNQQLSYPLLVAQANDARSPIFVAILGAEADENELENAARLAIPTQGRTVHLQQPGSSDEIFRLWQQQSNPLQLQYRSLQRQSGRNEVKVNLGTLQVGDSFEIDLAAPLVMLEAEDTLIRRLGMAHDTPLATLQPTIVPLTIQVIWPDNLPRRVTDVRLIANAQLLPPPDTLVLDATNQLNYLWDVSQLNAGIQELTVQLTDELGYQGVSDPLAVEIAIERPPAPTPTATLEPETLTPSAIDLQQLFTLEQWIMLGVGFVVLFLLIWLLRRWRRRRHLSQGEALEEGVVEVETDVAHPEFTAMLEWENDTHPFIELSAKSYTFGSDPNNAQIVLNDPSVSRLHARIVRRDDIYWLTDEGSASGTFLNYERLTLTPRQLKTGDSIKFGRISLRFFIKPAGEK